MKSFIYRLKRFFKIGYKSPEKIKKEYLKKQKKYFNSLSKKNLKEKFSGLTSKDLYFIVEKALEYSVIGDIVTEDLSNRAKCYFLKRKVEIAEKEAVKISI